MSMPFMDQVFTFKQPDGTRLLVRGTGNQHQATFTTLDGYTTVQAPKTTFYPYARDTDAAHPQPTGVQAGTVDPATLGLRVAVKPPPAPTGVTAYVSPGLPRSRSRWQIRREDHRLQALAAL